jgi:hypothetical protein
MRRSRHVFAQADDGTLVCLSIIVAEDGVHPERAVAIVDTLQEDR